jgi:hypothetical protein
VHFLFQQDLGVLQLLGEPTRGAAQLSHAFAQGARNLRQALGSEDDQRNDENDEEFRSANTEHEPINVRSR